MAKTGKANGKGVTIVIRKEEVVEGGHHGGAWKVAYADFVTAMMAFFLLMWLLNATTEEQRRGLADYFSPSATLVRSTSGSGLPLGGRSPFTDGDMASDRGAVQALQGPNQVVPDAPDDNSDTPARPLASREGTDPVQPGATNHVPAAAPQPDATGGRAPEAAEAAAKYGAEVPNPAQRRAEAERAERAAFEQAAQQLRDAVGADPALASLSRQMAIDMTPEGLRIQLLDEEKLPMFATGSAVPDDRARLLLQKVAPVLMKLSEGISIAGHTDAAPYRGADRTNWDLSADRANATRRLLVDAGLPEARIRSVTGNADRDPLLPADPLAAANRRIAIVVLRAARPPAP